MVIPRFYLKHITLQHGEVSLLSKYEVVQHLDAYDVLGLPQAPCHIPILHTGLQVATGVVVGYQDGCCALSYSLNKDLRLYLADCTL